MESLHYRFEHGQRPLAAQPQLVGVVSSGNLEVLIEPAA
ncbi:MAG TPA: malonate decarboxylase acyl carrier protein, partial [Telluria sp.]|nr:malonate decarboxylase acyl carrier protein [Telluria sp.]